MEEMHLASLYNYQKEILLQSESTNVCMVGPSQSGKSFTALAYLLHNYATTDDHNAKTKWKAYYLTPLLKVPSICSMILNYSSFEVTQIIEYDAHQSAQIYVTTPDYFVTLIVQGKIQVAEMDALILDDLFEYRFVNGIKEILTPQFNEFSIFACSDEPLPAGFALTNLKVHGMNDRDPTTMKSMKRVKTPIIITPFSIDSLCEEPKDNGQRRTISNESFLLFMGGSNEKRMDMSCIFDGVLMKSMGRSKERVTRRKQFQKDIRNVYDNFGYWCALLRIQQLFCETTSSNDGDAVIELCRQRQHDLGMIHGSSKKLMTLVSILERLTLHSVWQLPRLPIMIFCQRTTHVALLYEFLKLLLPTLTFAVDTTCGTVHAMDVQITCNIGTI